MMHRVVHTGARGWLRGVGLALLLGATLARAAGAAEAATAGEDQRLAWFKEARFGLFIHWGLYAVPAGEWAGKKDYGEWIQLHAGLPNAEYEKLAARFNPVQFDAREWVRIAKEAGMKYMVVTAKHHDGFCMYDSRVTDYNIVKATPYKRDPMKALAEECARAGLTFCFYYSLPDWHHPEFPAQYSQRSFHGNPNPKADLGKYLAYAKDQLRELLTGYGPIGILWFDGGGSFREEGMAKRADLIRAQELVDMIHAIQPRCLVNNRLGLSGDYGTPEQMIPGERQDAAFEVCMTLNRHWGYNKSDQAWKTPETVIRNLVDIVSKGGNYLLNVGPTAEGLIPADSTRILQAVGQWMARNGEAIYGNQASPIDVVPEWGRLTYRAERVYLHVFDWPKGASLTVQGLTGRVKLAYLLADAQKKPLAVAGGPDGWRVSLPQVAPDSADSVVVLQCEGLVVPRRPLAPAPAQPKPASEPTPAAET